MLVWRLGPGKELLLSVSPAVGEEGSELLFEYAKRELGALVVGFRVSGLELGQRAHVLCLWAVGLPTAPFGKLSHDPFMSVPSLHSTIYLCVYACGWGAAMGVFRVGDQVVWRWRLFWAFTRS